MNEDLARRVRKCITHEHEHGEWDECCEVLRLVAELLADSPGPASLPLTEKG